MAHYIPAPFPVYSWGAAGALGLNPALGPSVKLSVDPGQVCSWDLTQY